MIPAVGSLQKLGEEFLLLASVDSIREESYYGKKRDFSRRTIVLGTVVRYGREKREKHIVYNYVCIVTPLEERSTLPKYNTNRSR